MGLVLHAPVKGYLVHLENVPDPVFAEKMVGDGFAIEPLENRLLSPIDGVVKSIAKANHAITIATESGYDVLVHLGLETVKLNGQGIHVLVNKDDVINIQTPIIEFDWDYVSKHAKSLLTPIIISNYQGQALEVIPTGVVAENTPVLTINNTQVTKTRSAETSNNKTHASKMVTIINKHGIHARPAALLRQSTKPYDAEVTIHKAEQSAPVSSIVAMLGLGIEYQNEIQVTATGVDASKAVDAVVKMLANLVEYTEVVEVTIPTGLPKVKGNTYYGIAASKGQAIGCLSKLEDALFEFDELAKDPDQEQAHINQALAYCKKSLNDKFETHKDDPTKTALISAHIELLDDSLLLSDLKQNLQEGKTAEYAWDQAISHAVAILNNAGNALLIERIADLKDLRNQVLEYLSGKSQQNIQFKVPTVLYSNEFTLSDILALDSNVVGLISTKGGKTSHATIIANSKNIPLLIQVDSSIDRFVGQRIILDADNNQAIAQPADDEISNYQTKIDMRQKNLLMMQQQRQQQAKTTDGIEIHCHMNIRSATGYGNFATSGAEGIGLFRTEFIFYDRTSAPSEDQQLAIYQQVLQSTDNKPVIIRLLDAGGDKSIDYLEMSKEINPSLGVKGIRLCLRHQALLRTQIRAIIRTENVNARIMLPMVTNIVEFRAVKTIYEEERIQLGIDVKQPLGIMVEVPSAVLQAPLFAQEVDFMSIGSNDLTQYLLAIDRENDTLAAEVDHLHPVVLQSIYKVQTAAKQYNTPLSICGMIAADDKALGILIGLGIRHLSMSKNKLAKIKASIRQLNAKHCEEIAQQALLLEDAKQVRKLVEENLILSIV